MTMHAPKIKWSTSQRPEIGFTLATAAQNTRKVSEANLGLSAVSYTLLYHSIIPSTILAVQTHIARRALRSLPRVIATSRLHYHIILEGYVAFYAGAKIGPTVKSPLDGEEGNALFTLLE